MAASAVDLVSYRKAVKTCIWRPNAQGQPPHNTYYRFDPYRPFACECSVVLAGDQGNWELSRGGIMASRSGVHRQVFLINVTGNAELTHGSQTERVQSRLVLRCIGELDVSVSWNREIEFDGDGFAVEMLLDGQVETKFKFRPGSRPMARGQFVFERERPIIVLDSDEKREFIERLAQAGTMEFNARIGSAHGKAIYDLRGLSALKSHLYEECAVKG